MATPLEVAESAKESGRGIQRVRYTHDAMIDLMLMRPGISQNEIALYFNYSVGWVSSVVNSDAFQARLAARKTEVVDPIVVKNLEERMDTLAHQSLDVLQKKLQATENPDLAVKALELSTKALGMGARAQNVQQNNTFVVALPEKAADEKAWAATAKGNIIDAVPKVPDAASS
jgi:hypothetical protein